MEKERPREHSRSFESVRRWESGADVCCHLCSPRLPSQTDVLRHRSGTVLRCRFCCRRSGASESAFLTDTWGMLMLLLFRDHVLSSRGL